MSANDAVTEARDITQTTTKFEKYLDNGEYLPLGAWAVRGYDIARIEANAGPDDVKDILRRAQPDGTLVGAPASAVGGSPPT